MSSNDGIGYFARPNYDEQHLFETVGYVRKLWVEQEGARDQIKFLLEIHHTWTDGDHVWYQNFSIYLDRGTTVAYAQLQLLRDAIKSMASKQYLLVQVHFSFEDESRQVAHAYWLALLDSLPYPSSVQSYYEEPIRSWYAHLE